MKAMVLTALRKSEITDVPEPVIINPDDVKIRVTVVGICGSDIHYFTNGRIGSQVVEYPFTVGHEGAGIVVETGKAVTRVKPGDKIAIEPAMPCWKCDQCLSGRQHTCRALRYLGCPGQASGCLSEYIVMPEGSCFVLPGNLNADHGSISEPLSIGVYAEKKSGGTTGLKTGILGFGPIGMSVMLAAKAHGCKDLFVTEPIKERCEIASKEGARVTGNPYTEDITARILMAEPLGLDIVFECCGRQEAFDQAVELVKPGGKIVIVGIPEFDEWSMSVDKTRRKEVSIQFIRRQVDCVEHTIEMMANGTIDISNMVTHRFPLGKAHEAFEFVAAYSEGVMKAMIDI